MRQDLQCGTMIFDLVTLTLEFDLLSKNFNLGHSVWTRWCRTFIFHVARPSMPYHDFWSSDLDLSGCPTLKKIVMDYDFWIRGVTYCCHLHTVAAGELCCLSDNSVCNRMRERWVKKMHWHYPLTDWIVGSADRSILCAEMLLTTHRLAWIDTKTRIYSALKKKQNKTKKASCNVTQWISVAIKFIQRKYSGGLRHVRGHFVDSLKWRLGSK